MSTHSSRAFLVHLKKLVIVNNFFSSQNYLFSKVFVCLFVVCFGLLLEVFLNVFLWTLGSLFTSKNEALKKLLEVWYILL